MLRTLLTRVLIVIALHDVLSSAKLEPPPNVEPLGTGMEGYPYPAPVQFYKFQIDGEDVNMAYMDVCKACGPRTVVLMHGKNFWSGYWESQIAALVSAQFRVVAVDQIGFGKSSKPDTHYSFHRHASWTHELLVSLGVTEVDLVAHSFGGMVASRFALLFPDFTRSLVLTDPIGLEDYREKVPYAEYDALYENELDKSWDSLLAFYQNYFVTFLPAYIKYPLREYRMTLSPEFPRVATASALTYRELYEQPVIWEFKDIVVPTLLMIGQQDRTCPRGFTIVDPDIVCGDFPQIQYDALAALQNGSLVMFHDSGHLPFVEEETKFNRELIEWLRRV